MKLQALKLKIIFSRGAFWAEQSLFNSRQSPANNALEASNLNRKIDLKSAAIKNVEMKPDRVFFALWIMLAMILHGEAAPEVVNFAKIIPLLPSVPLGWTGSEPDGATTDMGGVKMTTAGRTYTKGEGEDVPSVSFNVIDFAGNKSFCDATRASWNSSQESPTGYMKAVKVGGYPGFESYDKTGKTGQCWVMVAERFFVHVETLNQEAAEMQVWMNRLDLKKLAELK